MSNYRRARIGGATFFFTVVAFGRRPILTNGDAPDWLSSAWKATCRERPFKTVAMVLLPDHLHCLWQLPEGDEDFSTRMRLIKARFTHAFLAGADSKESCRPARRLRGERDVWQPRFWEHTIRDDDDFGRHVDYVHWNPVKHGHARQAFDWPYSTFRRFVARGIYEPDWGSVEPEVLRGMDLEGEWTERKGT